MRNLWHRLFRSAKPAAPATPERPSTQMPAAAPAPEPVALPTLPLPQLADRFCRFVLGVPHSDVEAASNAELATQKRLDTLAAHFDMSSLPRLPTVLPQLLRALRNDRAGGGELAKMIGRDPLMVGEIMRVTNSAHYRQAQPISSLQHAVVLLGQDGLRQVITQHAMKPILQASAGTLGHAAGERLWQHAERCAHACAWLGRHTSCDAFEAYLGGIVCHAGDGAVIRLLDRLKSELPAAPSSAFLAAYMRLSARLSLQVATYWELPRRVIEAVKERQTSATPATSPLGQALAAADLLAMAHSLVEDKQLDELPDLSHSWPELFTPNLLERCQQDLQRHFPFSADASHALS